MTGGRCSQVNLALVLNGPDRGRSLLTGGRCSEVVVNTGLTVHTGMASRYVKAFTTEISSLKYVKKVPRSMLEFPAHDFIHSSNCLEKLW